MYVFYEETVVRKCQIKADISELLEYESLSEFIEEKRKYDEDFEIYEEEKSKPINMEVSNLSNFENNILNEVLTDNDMTEEEYKEFINATIWDYRGLYGLR